MQFSWISSANYIWLQPPAKTRKKSTAKSYFNNDHQLQRQDSAVRVATTQVPASTRSVLKHLCHGWHFDFLHCRAGVEPSMKEKESLTIQAGIKQPNITAVAWGQSQSVFKHFSNVLFKYLMLPEASIKCSQCFHYIAMVTATECAVETAENVLLHALNGE